MEKLYNGIDVSRWQGAIDWTKVKAAGIDFAIIRVGYCGYAGEVTKDPYFEANITGAVKAGVDAGVYLYSYAQTATAARTAAREVLELVKAYTLTYPVVFDMETEGTSYASLGREANTAIAKAFLSTVADGGYCPMLYTFKSFAESYLNMSDLSGYDFWLAHVTAQTTYSGPYTIWQYSWTGTVNGISGDVDLDYCYKDYPAYIKENKLNGFTGDDGDEAEQDTQEQPDTGEEEGDTGGADTGSEGDDEHDEDDIPLEPAGVTYKVVKNDNLTNIAKKYNLPLRVLLQANPTVTNSVTGKTRKLGNPDVIYVGDLIHIPAQPAE